MTVMQRPGQAAAACHWYTRKSQRSVTSGKEHVRIKTLEKDGQGQQAKYFAQLRPTIYLSVLGIPVNWRARCLLLK